MNETLIGYLTQEKTRTFFGKSDALFERLNALWVKYAQYVFKSPEAFTEWLSAPTSLLEGESPFNYATRTGDMDRIEDLVGRMAYGIMA